MICTASSINSQVLYADFGKKRRREDDQSEGQNEEVEDQPEAKAARVDLQNRSQGAASDSTVSEERGPETAPLHWVESVTKEEAGIAPRCHDPFLISLVLQMHQDNICSPILRLSLTLQDYIKLQGCPLVA